MYKIIRAGMDYCLAIAMTPADAVPVNLHHPEGTRFYRWATWDIHTHKAEVWNEISENAAWGYFSGHADGIGWDKLPDELFDSLEDARIFVAVQENECAKIRMQTLIDSGMLTDEERLEFEGLIEGRDRDTNGE